MRGQETLVRNFGQNIKKWKMLMVREDKVEVDTRGMGPEGSDWITLAQDRVQ